MDITTIVIWVAAIVWLIVSLIKNKKGTIESFGKAKNMASGMMGQILGVLLLIGLIVTFIPPQSIKQWLGGENEIVSSVLSALVGSITLIPAFVAFPLAGSLVESGASIVPVAAFITTLTMVGIVTYPLEKDAFGKKFAVTRNVLSFLFAIIISLSMGVIL